MSWHGDLLLTLVLAGLVAAALALIYVVYRGLRQDHEIREYDFTWGVAIVVLFLMGFAPGLVGLGLYLVVECGYPAHWLWIAMAVAVLFLLVASLAVTTTTVVTDEVVHGAIDPSAAAAAVPTR